MASFSLKLIFCFIAFYFFVHNVEARAGKLFFSKFTHVDHPNTKDVVTLSPAPAPELSQANGRLGDGHFGAGSGMIPQTKESWPVSSTTTTDAEFEKLMDTFEEEKTNNLPEAFEEEEEEEEEESDKYDNNNNNEYTYKTNNNYNDDKRGYGMSDTRFMDNGKYFYNTRGRTFENSPSRGYEGVRGNDHPNEFETMEEYYKSLEGRQYEYEP